MSDIQLIQYKNQQKTSSKSFSADISAIVRRLGYVNAVTSPESCWRAQHIGVVRYEIEICIFEKSVE